MSKFRFLFWRTLLGITWSKSIYCIIFYCIGQMSTNKVHNLICFYESCDLDILRLSSSFSAQGLRLQIHMPDSEIDISLLLRVSFYPIAVIVDLPCEASSQLLQMVTSTIHLLFGWIYLRQPDIKSHGGENSLWKWEVPLSYSNRPKFTRKSIRTLSVNLEYNYKQETL
jgi:hypothetical protein